MRRRKGDLLRLAVCRWADPTRGGMIGPAPPLARACVFCTWWIRRRLIRDAPDRQLAEHLTAAGPDVTRADRPAVQPQRVDLA